MMCVCVYVCSVYRFQAVDGWLAHTSASANRRLNIHSTTAHGIMTDRRWKRSTGRRLQANLAGKAKVTEK